MSTLGALFYFELNLSEMFVVNRVVNHRRGIKFHMDRTLLVDAFKQAFLKLQSAELRIMTALVGLGDNIFQKSEFGPKIAGLFGTLSSHQDPRLAAVAAQALRNLTNSTPGRHEFGPSSSSHKGAYALLKYVEAHGVDESIFSARGVSS